MKKFKDLAKEINENKLDPQGIATAMIEKVESAFEKHFPNGYFGGTVGRGIGYPHIVIAFGMFEKQSDCPNGIRENDKMLHKIMIHSNSADGNWEADNLEMSVLRSGIKINPSEGSYLAMETVKTGLRNMKKGTLAKAEKSLLSFIPKLAKLMKENMDNIYQIDKVDDKFKVVK